ncbi:MAG TPA: RNA-binding protein [Nitrososphaeraceae archaeon]|jgi:translin|nr:RNA-binding protein [Nitrososphaeraceae archaeon]
MLTSVNKLQESLRAINEELKRTEERREKLLKETREIVSLCSKSIVDMHYQRKKEAKEKLTEANTMLVELRNYTTGDLQKYLSVPEQEFVEASTLMSIVENSEVPGLPDLKVSGSAYTMGLLDCVGEIKRMIYDRVRAGSPEGAHDLFNFMEQIYSSVYPFAIYDNLVGGLKRKLDVAKMLIEDVRVLLTEESRRGNLIRAIEQLEERISGIRP